MSANQFSIKFYDRPDGAYQMYGPKKGDEELMEAAVVSEVGKPVYLPTHGGTFIAYMLRPPRKPKNSKTHGDWLYGQAFLGDAFAEWYHELLVLPAEGTSQIVNPYISPYQLHIGEMFDCMSCDVVYMIKCPCPLGMSALLEVYFREINDKAVVRSVRWKPSVSDTLCVIVPWSSTKAFEFHHLAQNKDQKYPGFSIEVKTLEQNIVEDFMYPPHITVSSMFINVRFAKYKVMHTTATDKPTPAVAKTYSMIPRFVTKNTVTTTYNEIDPGTIKYEQSAPAPDAQAASDTADPGDADPVPEGPAITAPASVAKMAAEPKKVGKIKPTYKQLSNLNTKWVWYSTTKIDSTKVNIPQVIQFDPNTFANKSENMARAFNRNTWMTGDYSGSAANWLSIMVVSNKPPQYDGILEIHYGQDFSERCYHHIGGEPTMFPVRLDSFDVSTVLKNRAMTSPWVLTSERGFYVKWRLIAFNQLAKLDGVKCTWYIKPGNIHFQVPRRPKKTPKIYNTYIGLDDYAIVADYLTNYIRLDEIKYEQSGISRIVPEGADGEGEPGAIETMDAEDEELANDEFWIRGTPVNLAGGKTVTIPLDFTNIVDSLGAVGGDNVITEKFKRFAVVVPTMQGDKGPVIGEYCLVVHLPATVTCNIAHGALPADMALEQAEVYLDLSSILSIAGTAISSVGGSLMTGAVDTVAGMAKEWISGLGGAGTESNTVVEKPSTISGLIPIVRSILGVSPGEFPGTQLFGNLFLQALDIMGSVLALEDQPIMVTPYYKMTGVKFERPVFDGEPLVTFSYTPKIQLTNLQSLELAKSLLLSDKDNHKMQGKQIISYIAKSTKRNVNRMLVHDLEVMLKHNPDHEMISNISAFAVKNADNPSGYRDCVLDN